MARHADPTGSNALFPFDNSYARLPERFYASVYPEAVSGPVLIAFNGPLAKNLGLDLDENDTGRLAAIFSGNVLPPGAAPLAMAYAGHQFGNFVPKLGDGRAILLGEVVDAGGVRRDIQLKGAGPTPFSRRGDGRAALGPVLREYIVSEAFAALGIPATRALAAVLTGDPVYRETVLPGAVFTRVAASHVRVGTFQYFAARGDNEAVQQLVDYVIDRHYPDLKGADRPALALLQRVAARQAELIARWLGIGFIHGVMNTDNMTISGETIDFGPCAFLDEYDHMKVFSSIDQQGRYAYRNQPGIGQWNMARLAECLLPLLDADEERAVEAANGVLKAFGEEFQAAWIAVFRRKLGLVTEEPGDGELAQRLLAAMQEGRADFTLTFRRLSALAEADAAGGAAGLAAEAAFVEGFAPWQMAEGWLPLWRERLARQPAGDGTASPAALMRAVNPAIIPRNHRIEEAITAATEGDLAPFHRLLEAVSDPYRDRPEFADYRQAPKDEERVLRTFCGT
ncbi:protein adenylyltransferase SelO [Rhizobium sp. CSW-27]|uniref:protein adenylyltransferase SelO n=1 Tax=Rhizobium sp. CSW-27 TaxID=2839985 RepID=UPI001C01A86D|nr:YdiU family protein [Rhizobium sp. CSW-27]MBT9368607.1 YdiU family protein [Rhizobium sp. CSW-27]